MTTGGLDDYLDTLWDGWSSLQHWAGFWAPVMPMPLPLQPLAALGTMIALIAITGVALSSLALFITSALFLYLLLSQVFGFELSLAIPR